MKKPRIFIFFVLSLIACTAFAKVTFQLIPRQNVVSGENFQITFRLSVEDESAGNVSTPNAPEVTNCKLLSGPNRTTSQTTQIINGNMSSKANIDFTCIYRAGDPGKASIPPVSISVGGKTYTTSTGSFEILPPDAKSQANNQGASSTGQRTSLSEYFVRVIFSKSSVYEQEGVIATTKLYRPASNQTSIRLSAVPRTPVYEGFLSEELEANPEAQLENFNGKNYYTYELSRVLLFPQKAGDLKVTSGTYTLDIREQVGVIRLRMFATPQYEDYSYTTPLASATIRVKSLPEPRPADFCGAVGNFTLTSALTPEHLRTNESATYSLTFKGTGNVKYLTEPTVDFPTTFDKYSPKTDIHANITGQTYSGTYTVDFPLVPQEVGKYEIPGQSFSFFDLSSQKYVQLNVAPIPVNVERGSAVAVVADQKQIDTSMNDILHIRPLSDFIEPMPSPVFSTWWFWTLWALGVIALIISVVVYKHQIKLNADVAGRRNARANKVAIKRFKTAASFMKKHQSEPFYEELAYAFKGYLGDKLRIPPSGLISNVISERLAQYGASPETIEEALNVLDVCEMARFTPSQSDAAMQDVYEKASSVIKTIEEIKIKK